MEKKKQSLVKGKGKGKPIAKPRLKGAKTSVRTRSLTGKTFELPEGVRGVYAKMEKARRDHNVCPGFLQQLFHTKWKYQAASDIFQVEVEKILPQLVPYKWAVLDPEDPIITVLGKLK